MSGHDSKETKSSGGKTSDAIKQQRSKNWPVLFGNAEAQHMFQFPGEIKMSLCLHDTECPVNSIKNNSQFGVGRTELVRLVVIMDVKK